MQAALFVAPTVFHHCRHLPPQSVFPAEARETIGGDACLADIFPEVRLQVEEARNEAAQIASENIERGYLVYDDTKTVFCAEACDDLGGEFCEADYQRRVY